MQNMYSGTVLLARHGSGPRRMRTYARHGEGVGFWRANRHAKSMLHHLHGEYCIMEGKKGANGGGEFLKPLYQAPPSRKGSWFHQRASQKEASMLLRAVERPPLPKEVGRHLFQSNEVTEQYTVAASAAEWSPTIYWHTQKS